MSTWPDYYYILSVSHTVSLVLRAEGRPLRPRRRPNPRSSKPIDSPRSLLIPIDSPPPRRPRNDKLRILISQRSRMLITLCPILNGGGLMILDAHHPPHHQEAQEQEQEQESGGMRDQTPSMSLLTYSKKWYPPPPSLLPLSANERRTVTTPSRASLSPLDLSRTHLRCHNWFHHWKPSRRRDRRLRWFQIGKSKGRERESGLSSV